jgi:leucyl-tRNA synthetase
MGTMINNWDRVVITCLPEYYRWNQWIFIQIFKKGLIYQGKALSNWCPSCQTVLANENVVDGKCWRCDSQVEQKQVPQWFIKITKYAERLLWGVEPAVDWPQSVREGQNNWIGKSEGAEIKFKIKNQKLKIDEEKYINVFTTRADTLFGVTALVLAPEHWLINEILNPLRFRGQAKFKIQKDKLEEIKKYVNQAMKKQEQERLEQVKAKTGVDTGLKAIHPLTGEEIPIWVADYVLGWYGEGAVMMVPAHDERDYEFAQKFNLPIKVVILSDKNSKFKIQNSKLQFKIQNEWKNGAFTDYVVLVNYGEFTGLTSKEAIKKNY